MFYIRKRIVAYAQAVGQQATEIDGKVCKKKVAQNGAEDDAHGKWSCVDNKDRSAAESTVNTTFSSRFGSAWDGKHAASTSGDGNTTNKGWPGTEVGKTYTAGGIASDLNTLQRPEKTKVAGLLSKTISGAEVV